ncbi:hypothetical protein K438DRAFT_1778994 [Mycena galopus ATCC 62051]|nr:hypothetical protein K438DRAFT_1778994 [Mycena galopus ATCC 62051]
MLVDKLKAVQNLGIVILAGLAGEAKGQEIHRRGKELAAPQAHLAALENAIFHDAEIPWLIPQSTNPTSIFFLINLRNFEQAWESWLYVGLQRAGFNFRIRECLVLQRDVVITSKTGSGKTLIAVVLSLIEDAITVIVALLISLLEDWEHHLDEFGLVYKQFKACSCDIGHGQGKGLGDCCGQALLAQFKQ